MTYNVIPRLIIYALIMMAGLYACIQHDFASDAAISFAETIDGFHVSGESGR